MNDNFNNDEQNSNLNLNNNEVQQNYDANDKEEIIKEQIERPKNKKMNIISIILIIVIFVGLALYMIHVDGLDNIIELLKSVDYRWVFARCWNLDFMVDL